ncbi:pentatricopeptide repeat-containing protein At1g05600 [Momordica charantia]|uniref:Pentatricopeptide repeat-containing protein At1g05600 n=1 Tax=Momordica charantia TaxID=3673 RepID=A0A6J1DVG7_MOMCH|nr:pentatricopeptide repeat-containing protein At1g05600 [Momordica charantia]
MTVRWPRMLTPTHLSQIIRKQNNPFTAFQLFKEAKCRYPGYRHNGPVYAAMIDILGNSGRVVEMREVIDQMKDDSCECKDSVFSFAIKTYASHGLLEEGISLFKSLGRFNCTNRTQTFNTLLEILLNESRLDAACQLFQQSSYGWGVKSRTQSLNLLMQSLCQRAQSELALHIFQEMDYQGCYPNRLSYLILMKGLCQDGRLNEAVHLLYSMFWRISQRGSGGDIVIYRTLLYALCANGEVEQAVEILGKILRKGLKAPKRVHYRIDLDQCKNSKLTIDEIKRLFNEALIKGGIPSLATYCAMAVDLYNENVTDQGDKVVSHMLAKGFRPPSSIYEAKAAALCKEGKVDDAMRVIDEETVKGSCIPSVALYNIVLKGLSNEGKSTVALEYLKKMAKQVGLVADKETYSILVHGLCAENRYIEACKMLEEMVIKSYRPCSDTFNTLIGGLCSIGKQYEAVMWLEEMISQGQLPELSVWNSLVSSVCFNVAGTDVWTSEVLQQIRH